MHTEMHTLNYIYTIQFVLLLCHVCLSRSHVLLLISLRPPKP